MGTDIERRSRLPFAATNGTCYPVPYLQRSRHNFIPCRWDLMIDRYRDELKKRNFTYGNGTHYQRK